MKLNKISLQNLSQAEMAKTEQNLLRGGHRCSCAAACMCTNYTTASGYYDGSNMIGLDDYSLMQIMLSNQKTDYSY